MRHRGTRRPWERYQPEAQPPRRTLAIAWLRWPRCCSKRDLQQSTYWCLHGRPGEHAGGLIPAIRWSTGGVTQLTPLFCFVCGSPALLGLPDPNGVGPWRRLRLSGVPTRVGLLPPVDGTKTGTLFAVILISGAAYQEQGCCTGFYFYLCQRRLWLF